MGIGLPPTFAADVLGDGGSTMEVLVVDDSPAVRLRVVARLTEAGLEVIAEAGTVAEALACVAARVPDAIVLDLQLPDGNGLDVLPVVKACVPAPVVVVLTNAGPPSYRARCLARGADAVLDKSTEFEGLVPTLLALQRTPG